MLILVNKIFSKPIFKSTLGYTLGSVLNNSIPFFLLPIITRYLSPSEYGIVSNYITFVAILNVFVGFSSSSIFSVKYYKLRVVQKQVYLFNILLILLVSTILVMILVYCFHESLNHYTKIPSIWVCLAVIQSFGYFLNSLTLNIWRLKDKVKFHVIFEFLLSLLNIVISLWLVVWGSCGSDGRLIGIFSSVCIFSLISIFIFFRANNLKFYYKYAYFLEALKYGIQIIPHVLSNWIKTGLDRIFITIYLGECILGIYAVGYQLGIVLSIVATAFQSAFSPYLFKNLSILKGLELEKFKVKIVLYTYLYLGCILFITIFLILFFSNFIHLLVGEQFVSSLDLICWFVASSAFKSGYFIFGNYLLFEKKTKLLSKISIIISMLHGIILVPFIKYFEVYGAVYALFFTSIITFIIIWYYSNTVYPMPWKSSLKLIVFYVKNISTRFKS
jgi:O-antigen/teichoic acid export membrane protein